MKILWITNNVIGAMHEKLYGKPSKGVWMDALLEEFVSRNEHDLVIATTGNNREVIAYQKGRVHYYLLSGGIPLTYNHLNAHAAAHWEALMEKESPDLIQIWGSEFKQGLSALLAAPEVPAAIYMQGLLEAISRYYEAGIPWSELRKMVTFRDIVKQDSILKQKRDFAVRAHFEKEMLSRAGHIICENEWCAAHCKAINPRVMVHKCPLSINIEFEKHVWNPHTMIPHTLMCNASGYPLKGLHILLRAVALLKPEFPDIRLFVPGTSLIAEHTLSGQIRKSGYMRYIEQLIKELGISDQVTFMGSLIPAKMGAQLTTTHVFVLASALENHSSSLKEAMLVGVPCVASAVGGIPEYVQHGENGLLYRFEDYEMLAAHIREIFEDDQLAARLSIAGRSSMLHLHDPDAVYRKTIQIYEEILDEGK